MNIYCPVCPGLGQEPRLLYKVTSGSALIEIKCGKCKTVVAIQVIEAKEPDTKSA